jgi:hypothetical protein
MKTLLLCSLAMAGLPRLSDAQAPKCWPNNAADVFAAGGECLRVWADSLRSPEDQTAWIAREALAMRGGTDAVAALRAEDSRRDFPPLRWALIWAMATTASPEDVTYLTSKLAGPDRDRAIVALGLMRATTARDTLLALLARTPDTSASKRWLSIALARIERPCSGTAGAPPEPDLIRIVMQCDPEMLHPGVEYDDGGRGLWTYTNGTWVTRSRVPADSAIRRRVFGQVTIAPDGETAFVGIRMWCGSLCGEGWSYRLKRVAGVWRVIGGRFDYVS